MKGSDGPPRSGRPSSRFSRRLPLAVVTALLMMLLELIGAPLWIGWWALMPVIGLMVWTWIDGWEDPLNAARFFRARKFAHTRAVDVEGEQTTLRRLCASTLPRWPCLCRIAPRRCFCSGSRLGRSRSG